MSKMFNLKQQKKYRNETINVLTHLNSRTTVNKLDKSIKSFKNQKQQVKSSRVQNSSMLYKKDNHSIDSQSRNGEKSYKSTKKNSLPKYSKNLEQSLENRLKKIYSFFNGKTTGSQSVYPLQLHIQELGNQFKNFRSYIEERKEQMIYDDFDYLICNILKCFQIKFGTILHISANEHVCKIEQIGKISQKIIGEMQKNLIKEQQKFKNMTRILLQQIQNLTVKSLYTTQKINCVNYLGILDFQKHCRTIDKNYKDQDLNSSYDEKQQQNIRDDEDQTQQFQDQQLLLKEIIKNNWVKSPSQNQFIRPQFQSNDYNTYELDDSSGFHLHSGRNIQNGKIRKQIPTCNIKLLKNQEKKITLNPDNYQRVNLRGGEFKFVLKQKQ